ncbi:DNA repair ATPase [Actinomadura viridis]|nr:DNA repair ATPase [Actinomadura viridis]
MAQDTGIREEAAPDAGIDEGTYEVLRRRLAGHAAELAERAGALDARRLEVFGGTELRLLGTERIRTADACVPGDILPVGGYLLFGHNPVTGAKPETGIEDVLSLHRLTRGDGDGIALEPSGAGAVPGLLDDPRFGRDFTELYRYYRQARILRLRRAEGGPLAVFQTGPRLEDVRVLRWSEDAAGAVGYLDNRGERDHVVPPAHDFAWTEATREDHVPGRHPHISVQDEVYVDTLGGTLTVKAENDTGTGTGIHSEPVDEPLQSLADADVHHARVGALILLRVRPYKETAWRYLVFNVRTGTVTRIDRIGQACRRLPGEEGIVFPGGYHLGTGAHKTFDTEVSGLEYEGAVRSPTGEDVLYVFRSRTGGRSLLMHYNTIRKRVAAPIACHGHALFDDGTLVVLRALPGEPARVHPVQVWRTPYLSDAQAAARPAGTGPLARVGEPELVGAISGCLSVVRMVEEMEPTGEVFQALRAACARVADLHPWLGDEEFRDLLASLDGVREAAGLVLAEYDNVQALTRQAGEAVEEAAATVAALLRSTAGGEPETADAWIARLAELRRAQGHLETLREMRHADHDRIDELASALAAERDGTGRRTVGFLRGDGAFAAYHAEIDRLTAEAGAVAAVADAEPVAERLAAQTEGLEIVTDVVGGLDIADATARTAILERVGEVLAGINRARALLDSRRRVLRDAEDRAAFAAEYALLDQAVAGGLSLADTPERCDEQLGRLLLQIENLEARFADHAGFLERLEAKRADVYEAFSTRRQALLDERARRADRLAASAGRLLAGVRRRAAALTSLDEVNTYFGTDPMVARLRSVSGELRASGEQGRAEELDGRIKAARQEAARGLRDRIDLYDDGGESIRLGRHRFAVSTRPAELTLVPHDGALAFAVTGTGYRSPIGDVSFEATRPFWDRFLVSETPELYRAEYLAASVLLDAEAGDPSLTELHRAAGTGGDLAGLVRKAAEGRYGEGYERGVHDHDATLLLDALLRLHADAGPLRHPPAARAAARLYWTYGTDEDARTAWTARAVSLARARATFGPTAAVADLCAELDTAVAGFCAGLGLPSAGPAGEYLFEELATAPEGFVVSARSRDLLRGFRTALGDAAADFDHDLKALGPGSLTARHQLAHAWLEAYRGTVPSADPADLPEAIAALLCDGAQHTSAAPVTATVDGLLGTHPRLDGRSLRMRLDETLARVRRHRVEYVPAYHAYQRRRAELIAGEERRLRLDDHRPGVMSTFVRNALIDTVYLPLIGDNLAKQLGAAGADRRTDQMGLLLLVSPPGYGKTTLMEYVAERLGLLMVKVDGPALGHAVTSLDPDEAPDATARREVEKINLAFELGDNVLLHIDDIQHLSPELLQKFIPLCDAQRRIEGVRDGRARTYDLRGRRFAVCMAGNPYTGAGARFRIPDMLANRADVWNLGEVLSGRDDLFALSYVENALTSNPVLAPLSGRDPEDLRLLLRLAEGDEGARPDRLAHPYSRAELDGILGVLRNLLRAREVVLTVNRAYIASAAQNDASRTEPPFRLQGSYRDMNRLAERILPVMNDGELDAVIDDHYTAEAQTLTGDAEANLLKLAELRGRPTPEQAGRWAEVKAGFRRAQALGGAADDPVGRAVGALTLLTERVAAVESAVDLAARRLTGGGPHP